jgi:hypothetical protein
MTYAVRLSTPDGIRLPGVPWGRWCAKAGRPDGARQYGRSMSLATYKDLCIDAADPHALSAFWGPLLAWESHPHDDGDSCLRVGDEVKVWINRVPSRRP